MKGLLLATALLATVTHVAQRRLDSTRLPQPATLEETLPSLSALKLLALGYDSLAADYYWLRAINEFGDARKHKAKFPNLVALMQRVLGLDPYFRTAYHFAGTALTVQELDPRASGDLLEQGLIYRPEDWKIPYLLGFNRYYFLHDYAGGAEALAKAARLPGAPDYTGPLAARLAAQGQVPEVGIALIDSILDTIDDPTLRESYEERRTLLFLELALRELNRAAADFAKINARPLRSLDELVTAGMMTEIPPEPLGGCWIVDDEGHVHTSNDGQRLRLQVEVQP